MTSGAWRLGQHVTERKDRARPKSVLLRFDQNKQRLPYLDELVFLVVPDQDAADLKFRAGGIDGVDDVKPENYRWYEENQQKGNFTLYDLGASQSTHLMWFNLNKVQPPVRGAEADARQDDSASRSSIRSSTSGSTTRISAAPSRWRSIATRSSRVRSSATARRTGRR